MGTIINDIKEMRSYLLLWFTQLVSGLGSAMTAYALVIWSYTQAGSALRTALLMVCSYAPYVVCSIFAGALSDRWNKKKTMLVCDALAALSTLIVLLLLKQDALRIWHLYIVNGVSGLMNTFQQPASEVATSALLKREYYQKVGGLRYLSNESVLRSAAAGVRWLKANPGIFHLMLFLAGINLVASMFNAALPAMALSRASETALGTVNAVTGITMLIGSILASFMPAPRSRVKAIWYCLMLSMCTENFFLAFGKSTFVWCLGAFLGWIAIPLMSANLEAVNRLNIPMEMQGRVFAARNSFQ